MNRSGARMAQEVFVMASPMELIKLLPWCISSAVPSQYINEALVTAVWLGENTPATTAVPETSGVTHSGAFWQSNSPSETPLPIIPLLPDLPFMGTPLVGYTFDEFLATSRQKKWHHSPSGSLDHQCSKRTGFASEEVKTGSDHSSTQDEGNMLGLILEAGPSSGQYEKETSSPLSCPSRAMADPDDVTAVESFQALGIKSHWTLAHPKKMWKMLTWTQPPKTGGHANTWRYLYEWLTRGTGRGYGLPADWAKAVSGWRFNWKGQWELPGHVGTWPWLCYSRAEMWSSGRPQLL